MLKMISKGLLLRNYEDPNDPRFRRRIEQLAFIREAFEEVLPLEINEAYTSLEIELRAFLQET